MAQPTLVVDEVLMYVFSKCQSDHNEDLKRNLINFYDDSAMNTAKTLLWEHYSTHLDQTLNAARNNRGRPKKEKEAEDILSGVKDIESQFPRYVDLPVVFCAVHLDNLPSSVVPINPVTEVNQRLNLLELQMIEVLKDRITSRNAAPVVAPCLPATSQVTVTGQHPETQLAVDDNPTSDAPATHQTVHVAPGALPPNGTNGSEVGVPSIIVPNINRDAIAHVDAAPPNVSNHVVQTDNTEVITTTDADAPVDQPGRTSYKDTLKNNLGSAPWTTAGPRRRNRIPPVYGNRKGTTLSAGPREYELFVFRVGEQYTGDNVSKYVTDTDSDITVMNVVRLCQADVNDRSNYSYKVTIRCHEVATILSPDFWPEKVGCRMFRQKRRLNLNHQPTDNGDHT